MSSPPFADPPFEKKLPPANDRMLTTLFLAALLHGIVILGVSFSAPGSESDSDQAPGLEVILINDSNATAKRNARARYLAQANQLGSGNTLALERAQIPKSSPAPLDRPGAAAGDGGAVQLAGQGLGTNPLLATSGPSTRIVFIASSAAAKGSSALPLLLEKRPDLGMAANDDGVELRLRGEARKQLWVTADTRESDVAVYLDSWRHKVERVGTINFPSAARRQKLSGTPVVEVTIAAGIRKSTTPRSGSSNCRRRSTRFRALSAPSTTRSA
jgi:protein TonB